MKRKIIALIVAIGIVFIGEFNYTVPVKKDIRGGISDWGRFNGNH